MKRTVLLLLAAMAAFVPSFSKADYLTATVNAAAGDKAKKTVTIVIPEDSAQPILCSPDSLAVKLSKKHKVRWCVLNNSETDVSKVEVNFGSADPFVGGPKFDTGAISSGSDPECSASRLAKTKGTFKYKVTVTFADGSTKTLDPGVIIGD